MTTFRAKTWIGVSAVALASSLALSACDGGSGGAESPGGSGTAETPSPGGSAASAAPVGEGGEGGSEGAGAEAGAAAAFGAVPAASRDALRLAQLRGFYLAARTQTGADALEQAQVLVGQGLLEVYTPSQVEYTRLGLDEAVLRRAERSGTPADIDAAVASIDAARQRAGGDPAAVVRGMSDLAVGLYRETIVDGMVDPTEYLHSRGAALSAQVEQRNAPALSGARADMDRFVGLWPAEDAPEEASAASTPQQVRAQASRLQLALSGA